MSSNLADTKPAANGDTRTPEQIKADDLKKELTTQENIRKDVRAHLNVLHAEEFMYLSFEDNSYRARSWKYVRLIIHVIWNLVKFFFWTWSWTIWNVITLPMASLDIVSQLFWASVSCALLLSLAFTCLVLREPHLSSYYTKWSKDNGDSMTLINSPKPEIFGQLSDEELYAAMQGLDDPSKDKYTRRTFNVDIAKLLLLCASLIYERPEDRQAVIMDRLQTLIDSQTPEDMKDRKERAEQVVVSDGQIAAAPGAATRQKLGQDGKEVFEAAVDSVESQGTIERIAGRLGLEFHVVSELNSQGTSCCGLFYSVAHKFIILAFKGTSASEFDEWLTDCSFTAVDGSAWIRGFGNVQKGFMDRMFPAKLQKGARLPYDTIRLATKRVAEIILSHRPPRIVDGKVDENDKIDIWFTGHSLGCAMAALAYARANMEPRELGANTRIRDGYIFAAPVMCDTRSVNAFNNQLFHNPDHPRTLWRVTQGRDAVATALPAWGNAPRRRLSPFNMFGFAHLGTEITMKNRPDKCVLSGHHILPGAEVRVYSKFAPKDKPKAYKSDPPKVKAEAEAEKSAPKEEVKPAPPKNALLKVMNFMSYVPVVNRMVDHCTFMYWDQLCRIQHGEAVWDFDNTFLPSFKTLLGY